MKARLWVPFAGLAVVLAASGSGGTAAEPPAPAYGMVSSMAGDAQTLVRVDPGTLKPRVGGLAIPEGFVFGGRSPDGRSAVFFNFRRPSLRVVDLERLKNRGDIAVASVGWRARAAAWLTADRVAVVIQKMRGSYGQIVDRREVVIVDPLARRVVARRQIATGTALTASASGGDKLVLLLGRGDARIRTARVAVVDSSGAVRSVDVDLGVPEGLRLPSLVVEPSGRRAFVVAAGAPVFEIDLDTLEATPHVIRGGGAVLADAPLGSRQAVLLDGEILAVTGQNARRERGVEISRPAGLAFVDTSTWQARLVDRDVSGASVSGGTLVGYSFRIDRVVRGGRPAQRVVGIGLRAYAADGTRRWQRFGTQPLTARAFRDAALVYRHASPPVGWAESFVVDLDSGRQIGRNANPRQNFSLLPDVPGARPIRAPAAATAEALQVEGGGEEFRGTVLPEVTRVVAALVDGSERELTIEAGSVTYRAATPHESARTVQAFAGDQLVASISMPVACGGSAGPCAPEAASDAPPTYAFVGELPSGGVTLVRVDPRTLAPIGRGLRLAEPYMPSFARSPNGAEVAVAVSGKPLVRIVELASLRVSRTVQLDAGDEARALAWLDDDRLVAVVQRMSQPTRRYVRERAAVTVDTTSGRVVVRRPLTNKLAIGGVGVGGDRLVLLLRSSSNKGSTVALAVVEPDGTVRTRQLEVGKTRGVLNTTALAVAPSGKRAFVLGWAIQRTTPPVLEVDLDTLATTRRVVRVEHTGQLARATISTLRAGSVSDRYLVAFGAVAATERNEGSSMPAAGIFVIDTRAWTAKLLDPRGTYFQTHEGRVVTYGPSSHPSDVRGAHYGSGVSIYELPSRQLFHLYARRPFQRIEFAGDYGHVLLGAERTKRLVFDASAGKPLGMLPAIREPIQILPAAVAEAKTGAPSSTATSRAPAAAQQPTDPFSRVSNRGTRVKPKATKRGERELVPRDLFLLRRAEGRAVYRIGGLEPGYNTCYASGPGNDVGRLGSIICGRTAFPSRRDPLQNMSVMQLRPGAKNPQLSGLEGVAADAIAEIGLTDSRGNVIERVPVRDNVYVLARPPAAATGGLIAYDSRGEVVFRSDQRQQRPAAPAPATSPRQLAGFRLKITLPKGWSGEIRRSSAGPGRALLFAGNRLPARDLRSVSLALTERDPRARPAFQRVAEPPQLRRTDVRTVRSGQGRVERSFTFKGRQFALQIGLGTSRPSPAQLGEINRALATLSVGAIAVPPTTAHAGTPLQRGNGDSVSVDVYRSGIVVFHFDPTSRLYRQLQGTRVSASCLTFDSVSPWEPNQSGFSNLSFTETVQVIFSDGTRPQPPYATVDPATEAKPPFDGCLVGGSYGRRWNDSRGQHSPAEIAFTADGKRFFDERAVARDLAMFVRSPKLAAARRSLKQGGKAPAASALTRGLPARVLTLGQKGLRPATGEIGVWSDRRDTIEVSARSSGGKRLFIELRNGRIARHNLEGLAFVF